MKQLIPAFCLIGILLLAVPTAGAALPQGELTSDAYVVMDAQSGQVLAARNPDKREYPASITKVLTVALGLEGHDPDERITLTDEAVFSVDRDSTHIALTPGEEVSLNDMTHAAMLASANDAANAVAENAGGTLEEFIRMMNGKAKELGAQNTNFVNANGLYDPQHYTTAYDMALLTRWALTVPGFREVFGSIEYKMGPTNKQPEERNFGTYHHMIVESAYYYEGADGGQLGWTPESHHTIVTVAHRGGLELICVALNTRTQWEKYKDSTKLFDYCFENFEPVSFAAAELPLPELPLYSGEEQAGTLVPDLAGEVRLAVPKGTAKESLLLQCDAPERAADGEDPGVRVTFSLPGADEPLYTLPVQYRPVLSAAQSAPQEEKEPAGLKIHWIPTLAVLLLILLLVLRRVQVLRRRRRRRRLREQRLGR